MKSYALPVILAFALGVIVRDIAQDWRDEAVIAEARLPAPASAAPIPRPRCPAAWIVKRADQGPWIGKCLKEIRA